MNRLIYICFLSLFLIGSETIAEQRSLVILHTNDFHGHISAEHEYAGVARIAAFVKQTRATNAGVLVLDAGDRISGTPVSTMFEGLPIVEVLNEVGYNAAALGNHEFDHGYQQLLKFREIANYPFLAANAFAADGSLVADAPSLITEINGITIGIIGLITDETPHIITPTGNEGLSFSPPKETLIAMVAALRPRVDLLVVVSHVGHDNEIALAKAVSGIDLIVGGHSHTKVEPALKINDTYVVQAGYYGAYVGRIELVVDTDADRVSVFKGGLVAAADLPAPDQRVEAIVKSWEEKVAAIVDVEIAEADRDYTREELQSLFEAILVKAGGADLGFYNMGGIRDYIRKGPITARQVWNIEPFGNSFVTVSANGQTIKKILAMTGSTRVPVIQDEKVYLLATNSFIASQARKIMADQMTVTDKGSLVRDVLIEHFKRFGLLSPK